MEFKLNIVNAKDPKIVDVYLYGDIGPWNDDASPSKMAQLFNDLEKKHTTCRLHINSAGGQVTEGIAIHNILSNTSMKLEIYVDGIAASMAAVLVQVPGAKRYMSKYSKMMLHVPSGYAHGNSENLRQYAQMMDDFEQTLIDIICDRTGLETESVKAKWFDLKDHWLSPKDALTEKLIDGIVDGPVRKEPKNVGDPIAIYNFYQEQIQNDNTMDYSKLIAKLGLGADSSEDQVMDFVANLMQENGTYKTRITELEGKVTTLETAAADARKAQVKDLIDAAVAAKKITEAQRPMYESLFAADFDNTKGVLDAIQPYQPLTGVPGQDTAVIPEDRKNWSYTDWQKKDGKGLQNLKDKHPEEYQALYTKSFGQKQ